MEYRTLGSTGLQVSVLGYGASSLGDVFEVALRFAIEPAGFASTIVGSASVANMTRNVEWAAQPLNGELVGELQAVLAPVVDTAWPSGRPENNHLRSFDA